MKKLSKRTKIFAALAGISMATAAYALPAYWNEYEYYSDATYTELVGMWGQTCRGTVYQEGIKTNYKIQTEHWKC